MFTCTGDVFCFFFVFLFRYLPVLNISGVRHFEKWITMKIVPDNTTCITVYELVPGTAYQFVVLARTRTGKPLFSRPIATSTKGKFGTALKSNA